VTVTLAHPFRIDSAGRAVTVEQGSTRHAAECCGHIVSCEAGERPLAPLWGLIDPSGTRLTADEIVATIGYAEPALRVDRVEIDENADGTVAVAIDVDWTTTDDEESR
jgi:phage baseplate assembly protein W